MHKLCKIRFLTLDCTIIIVEAISGIVMEKNVDLVSERRYSPYVHLRKLTFWLRMSGQFIKRHRPVKYPLGLISSHWLILPRWTSMYSQMRHASRPRLMRFQCLSCRYSRNRQNIVGRQKLVNNPKENNTNNYIYIYIIK